MYACINKAVGSGKAGKAMGLPVFHLIFPSVLATLKVLTCYKVISKQQ